jgi:hypothetical protein
MKPKPLSALNHFTVPTVMDACPSLHRLGGIDHAGKVVAPAARDKLDLRVAKQNMNLCQATVAAVDHRALPHR